MILPSKHLRANRALLTVAAEILYLLDDKSTVRSLWADLKKKHSESLRINDVPFDWYILSLDLLFLMGIVEHKNGKIKRNVTKGWN